MDIFKKIEDERGMVARIYSDFAAFPESVEANFFMNKALMLAEDAPLPRAERELLAFKSSDFNMNNYCATHHKTAYENSRKGDENSGERGALLEKLAYVLTTRPKDAAYLRPEFISAGFSEAEWQHAVNIIAYFNYTNRLAFAMDMTLEDGYEKSCN